MIDPELKSFLNSFEHRLQAIQYKKEAFWRAFFNGIFRGFGSVVGVVIALAILGYVLNVMGIIPAFQKQVQSWQQTLDTINKAR